MTELDPAEAERLVEFLARSRGVDLRPYKRGTLTRRIQRRLDARGIPSIDAYLDVLELDSDEIGELLDSILINVTAFFRDPESWDHLEGPVLREVVGPADATHPIRIWSAGCSSGEEAYSLAIVLCELLGDEAFTERVKIFATDVDGRALGIARAGVYPTARLDGLPPGARERYFVESGAQASFRADLRPNLIFGRHNLLDDPPISRLDLLVCRNTLMYFNAEAQERILRRFQFALKTTGILFLGSAEMLTTRTNLFVPVDVEHRVFRPAKPGSAAATAAAPHADPADVVAAWARLGELDFLSGPSAHVVIDEDRHLVMANHEARRLFALGASDIGRPLRELPLSFRPLELLPRIDVVTAEERSVTVPAVPHDLGAGRRASYDVVFVPIGGSPLAVGVTWIDSTVVAELRTELEQLARDRDATAEELQSTNEELETTNEELQSTNEELETINEELQSTNEELQSMNLQLRRSSDERDRVSAFLEAVVTSLRQAVITIDADNVVQSWNERAEDLWGMRSDEVIGHRLSELDTGLPTELLEPLIERCLAGRARFESIDLAARDRQGRVLTCRATVTAMQDPAAGTIGSVVLIEGLA